MPMLITVQRMEAAPDPTEFRIPTLSARTDLSEDLPLNFKLSSRNSSNSDVAMGMAEIPASWGVSRPQAYMLSSQPLSNPPSGLDTTRQGPVNSLSYLSMGPSSHLAVPGISPSSPQAPGQFKILGLVGIMPPQQLVIPRDDAREGPVAPR